MPEILRHAVKIQKIQRSQAFFLRLGRIEVSLMAIIPTYTRSLSRLVRNTLPVNIRVPA